MAFTKPCDQCTNEDSDSCRNFTKCDRYRYWLNYCWKMARAAAKKTKRAEKPTTKWVYHHPDVNRKYIEEGICAKCPLNGNCDEPCGAYWDWCDTWMEYFRKVLGADG